MFVWVYISGTQLMTPERRKAVWAIYGMIYAAESTYPIACVQTNTVVLVCDVVASEVTYMFSFAFCCPVVWCRRTDELVDGPNASYITPTALDRWEKRLEDLFEGRPYDMYDAALSDTVSKFPVDIQVNLPTEKKKPYYILVDLAITTIY